MNYMDMPQEAYHHFFGRFSIIFSFVEVYKKETILDVGVGNYALLERKFPCSSIIGIDISINALANSRKKSPHSPLILADAQNLPIRTESIGFITLLAIIGMLPPYTEPIIFKEAHRVLKSNGNLLVLVSNNSPLMKLLTPPILWKSRQYKLEEIKNLITKNFYVNRILLTGSIFSAFASVFFSKIIFLWRVVWTRLLGRRKEPFFPLTYVVSKISSYEFRELNKKKFIARFIFILAKKR